VLITFTLLTRQQLNKNAIQTLQRHVNSKPWLSEQDRIVKYVQEKDEGIIQSVQASTNELAKLREENQQLRELVGNLQKELSLTKEKMNDFVNTPKKPNNE
jgi:hypothetical protein